MVFINEKRIRGNDYTSRVKMDKRIVSVLQNGPYADYVNPNQLSKFLGDIKARFLPILNDMMMKLEDDDEIAIEEILREMIKDWVEENESD